MVPFERSLSENQKIVEIGSSEFKLWQPESLIEFMYSRLACCENFVFLMQLLESFSIAASDASEVSEEMYLAAW